METRKGRILCVDDEPKILRSLNWLLQREFDVVCAPSGQAGLAAAGSADFDVILCDQRMPGMTGVEMLREARKVCPRAMRILLTGYSDLDAVMRSVNESEVFRFINKPWNIEELPRVVGEAVVIARENPAPEPAADPAAEPAADPAAAAGPTATAVAGAPSVRLLLIDEDPLVADLLAQSFAAQLQVHHARTLNDAVNALGDTSIGIIVSETRVGNLDATRLLKMLKEQYPEIVTIACSTLVDAAEIISLINQAQIYRFVPKPVKAGYLRLVIGSALHKHRQLRELPGSARRHAVVDLGAAARESLQADVRRLAQRAATAAAGSAALRPPMGGDTWLHRVTGGFRRLFGGA